MFVKPQAEVFPARAERCWRKAYRKVAGACQASPACAGRAAALRCTAADAEREAKAIVIPGCAKHRAPNLEIPGSVLRTAPE